MKTMLAWCLLLMLCHPCICICENNWTARANHSVKSRGFFSVTVNLSDVNNLDNDTGISWRVVNCEDGKEVFTDLLTTVNYGMVSPNYTVRTTKASARFYAEGFIFHSSLTILDLLEDYDGNCVELYIDACSAGVIEQMLTVKYCDPLSNDSGKLIVKSPKNASWNDITNYTCQDATSKIIVQNDYSNPSDIYSRNCSDDATWTGSGSVICAYAPTATIEDSNAPGNDTYFAGRNITLLCNVTDGYPSATKIRYYVQPVGAASNNQVLEIGEFFTRKLSPDLNKANFTCQGLNEFTKITDKTAGISKPIIPNVLFEPMSVGERLKSIKGVLGETTTLLYTFKANPLIVMENLILTFAGNGTKEEPLDRTAGDLSKNSTQTYTYNVKVVSILK